MKVKSLSRANSSRPHGLQPTRLLCPWDSPGKGTGVGCHMFTLTALFSICQAVCIPSTRRSYIKGFTYSNKFNLSNEENFIHDCSKVKWFSPGYTVTQWESQDINWLEGLLSILLFFELFVHNILLLFYFKLSFNVFKFIYWNNLSQRVAKIVWRVLLHISLSFP